MSTSSRLPRSLRLTRAAAAAVRLLVLTVADETAPVQPRLVHREGDGAASHQQDQAEHHGRQEQRVLRLVRVDGVVGVQAAAVVAHVDAVEDDSVVIVLALYENAASRNRERQEAG